MFPRASCIQTLLSITILRPSRVSGPSKLGLSSRSTCSRICPLPTRIALCNASLRGRGTVYTAAFQSSPRSLEQPPKDDEHAQAILQRVVIEEPEPLPSKSNSSCFTTGAGCHTLVDAFSLSSAGPMTSVADSIRLNASQTLADELLTNLLSTN